MPKAKKGGLKEGISIRFTTGTIVKVVAVVLGIIFLYYVREIVVLLLLALLLAALIDPLAHKFSKYKINRGFAVIGVYTLLFGVIVGVSLLILPTLKQQSVQLFEKYGPYLEDVMGDSTFLDALVSGDVYTLNFEQIIQTAQGSGFSEAIPTILSTASGAFGLMLSVVLVLALAFYLVVEEDNLRKSLSLITPKGYQPFIDHVLPKAQEKTGQWLRGQLLIMFVIFLVTYILLEFVLNIPFALLLAIIAGLLEVVPFIGPFLAVVPALVVALTVSPVHALLTGLAYLGVQQLEGHVLTPKIMERVTGINPVFSILAVLVGFELVGPVGAILAIPLAVVVGLIWLEWMNYQSAKK